MLQLLARKFTPVDEVSQADIEHAWRMFRFNGIGTQIMETLTLGTFLTAFALQLGASNAFIGLLAAAPYLANFGQLVGVYLVETLRNRRIVTVVAGFTARPLLFLLPLAALMPEPRWGLVLVFSVILVRYFIGSIQGVAWSSLVRDVVAEDRRGSFFGARVRIMTAIGMVRGLRAGMFVDHWAKFGLGPQKWAYCVLFAVAGTCGAAAIWPLAQIREPRMAPAIEPPRLTALLEKPFHDPNFRNLMIFLMAWNFAVNLAAPFFTVHMFQRLELNVFTVTALATTSQFANICVLAIFGRLTDRFSAKSVMAVSAPLFLLCVFSWVFTTRPAEASTTIALLAVIHLVTGVATAGVTIASTTITMRLAPKEYATAYLTANGLLTSLAAGIAPVLGGLTADFFIHQKLSLVLHWQTAERDIAFETLKIEHWDFFFVLAGLVGLYALHRLSHVVEQGSVSERVVIGEFLAETKRNFQNISPVAGLRQLTEWPFAMVQRRIFRSRLEAAREARRAQRRAAEQQDGSGADQTRD